MIYIETPTNPMMEICDINEISKIAKKYNCILVVDNTFMSPYNHCLLYTSDAADE